MFKYLISFLKVSFFHFFFSISTFIISFFSFFFFIVIQINTQAETFEVEFCVRLRYSHKSNKELCSDWWVPEIHFSNVVSLDEKSQPRFMFDSEAHQLTVIRSYEGTFFFQGDFSYFPFDSQLLSISIWSDHAHLQRKDIYLEDQKSKQWTFGNAIFAAQTTESGFSSEFMFYNTTNSSPVSSVTAEIPITRISKFYLINVVFPLYLFTAASWMSFFTPVTELLARMVIGILSLLCLLIFRLTISTHLPSAAYSNSIGYYFLVSYFFVFLVECLSVISSQEYTSLGVLNKALAIASFCAFTLFTLYFCSLSHFQRHRFQNQWA